MIENKAEHGVKKFESIESEVADLRNMADLASSNTENTLSGLKRRIMIADQKFITISEREADIILFSVYQVSTMAKDLQDKYHALLEAM